MGEAAFRKVVPAFSLEAMVERIEAVYAEVLAEKGLRPGTRDQRPETADRSRTRRTGCLD